MTADPASPEDRLAALGLQLPAAPGPLAHFEMCVRNGSLLFLSGHAPLRDGQLEYVGKVGREWDEAAGYQAARLTALNMIATLKAELGELRRVRRFMKLLGMVNCTEDFTRVPDVINGVSDLLIEVFGRRSPRPVGRRYEPCTSAWPWGWRRWWRSTANGQEAPPACNRSDVRWGRSVARRPTARRRDVRSASSQSCTKPLAKPVVGARGEADSGYVIRSVMPCAGSAASASDTWKRRIARRLRLNLQATFNAGLSECTSPYWRTKVARSSPGAQARLP